MLYSNETRTNVAAARLTVGMNEEFVAHLRSRLGFCACVLLLSLFQTGCDSGPGITYIDFGIDRFWKDPRDLLVDRVVGARDAQQETVEQFKTAMEEFKAVAGFVGGDLEEKYERLNAAFTDSEAAANDIKDRVNKVAAASERLLDEWDDELDEYSDKSFRRRSKQQYEITEKQCEKLIEAMHAAAQKTEPVLDAFRDQVLFLKHNLNMQAITSLDAQTQDIEIEVDVLIKEMERSINEADAFIEEMVKFGER